MSNKYTPYDILMYNVDDEEFFEAYTKDETEALKAIIDSEGVADYIRTAAEFPQMVNGDLDDYFEMSVDELLMLPLEQQVEAIDFSALQNWMERENEEYCEEENLCPHCRSELKHSAVYEEAWGARVRMQDDISCPNGCM